jgi:hypothetical protein
VDVPGQTLTYQLVNAPEGAAISPNGIIAWTPSAAFAPNTYTFTTVVTDNGAPPLSATNIFTVSLTQALAARMPSPSIQSLSVSNGLATIIWSAVSGQTYRLQYKDDLSDAGWHERLPDITAAGSTASAADPIGALPRRFYRILLVP